MSERHCAYGHLGGKQDPQRPSEMFIGLHPRCHFSQMCHVGACKGTPVADHARETVSTPLAHSAGAEEAHAWAWHVFHRDGAPNSKISDISSRQ